MNHSAICWCHVFVSAIAPSYAKLRRFSHASHRTCAWRSNISRYRHRQSLSANALAQNVLPTEPSQTQSKFKIAQLQHLFSSHPETIPLTPMPHRLNTLQYTTAIPLHVILNAHTKYVPVFLLRYCLLFHNTGYKSHIRRNKKILYINSIIICISRYFFRHYN